MCRVASAAQELAAAQSHLQELRHQSGAAAAVAVPAEETSGGSGGEEEGPMLNLSEPYDPSIHERAAQPAAGVPGKAISAKARRPPDR